MRIKWFSFVRVTGLLLVLLYHFFKSSFPGGFIGVDIFFTFSGYLITALLLDELTETKKIDILGFLRRRFYRIVPPVVLMLLISIPFVFLVKPDFRAALGNQVVATMGFMTNLYEIMTGGNYETQFIPHLFVHTWSLAIEVHYYVLWGLFLWLLSRHVTDAKRYRGIVFVASSSLFVLSFMTMFVSAFFVDNFSSIYFSSLAHSFPFFLGSLFATLTGIRHTTIRFQKNVRLLSRSKIILGVSVTFLLLFLLGIVLDFNHLTTYLFGFILSSFFAALMIYATRILSDQTPKAKEFWLLTYLADTSYGVYLFHWPFYIIFSQLLPNMWAVVVTLVLSYLFASFSFYVLEPFIAGKSSQIAGITVDLRPYQKRIYSGLMILGLFMMGACVFSPAMGTFETQLLVNSLKQADDTMRQTRNLTDRVSIGKTGSQVLIIGDSVMLSSSEALTKYLPNAQQDAAVSRNFDQALDIFANQIEAKTLPETVVIAVGVNSVYEYKEATRQFIKELPKGHHLVFVTAYNGKANQEELIALRDYEVSLAKKYPYVSVADWYQAAVEHPNIWIGTDGVHYKDNGSADSVGGKLYAETIKSALKEVANAPAKGQKKK